jgi:predicted aspartyl protease
MPVLHSSTTGGHGKTPDGKTVNVPPNMVLMHIGPRIPVTLMPPDAIVAALTKEGKPIPPAVTGLALIDTGAGPTSIDEEAAKKLGLPIINMVKLASASHASTDAPVYPVKMVITGLPNAINAPGVVGAPLACQGLVALIGRDLLAMCHFTYNGAAGEFTLCV